MEETEQPWPEIVVLSLGGEREIKIEQMLWVEAKQEAWILNFRVDGRLQIYRQINILINLRPKKKFN